MLRIEDEWRWELYEADKKVWQREFLIWRGIYLATIEGSDERWFGNLGADVDIEDWQSRCAHVKSREECKALIVKTLLDHMRNGLIAIPITAFTMASLETNTTHTNTKTGPKS